MRLISPGERPRWNGLVRQHHYLKNARLVGEQLRYVVTDTQGHWLALLGWSAPAMHLKARDQSIEWSDRQREGRLHLLAQNSRFVILAERQQFPNLASRALSLCLQRLSADWQGQYHHPIVMVETFVDRASYQATAYKASGWQPLGYSSGFKPASWKDGVKGDVIGTAVRLRPGLRRRDCDVGCSAGGGSSGAARSVLS